MTTLTEADVEVTALDWLAGLGWRVAHGRASRRIPPTPSGTTTAPPCWSGG